MGPMLLLPRGVLSMGDANEWDLALSGEMAGPMLVVGPTLADEVSVKDKYHGFTESKWCETVNENLDDEHDPILPFEDIEEGLNLSDAALGYAVKSLNSKDSSKSSDDTTMVNGARSTNVFTPYKNRKNIKLYVLTMHQ